MFKVEKVKEDGKESDDKATPSRDRFRRVHNITWMIILKWPHSYVYSRC
jgi:hypothetical protein